jgi:hypothetical protein
MDSTGVLKISFASIFGNFRENFASKKTLFCIKLLLLFETQNIRKLAKPEDPIAK